MKNKWSSLLLLVAIVTAGSVEAHGIWFAQRSGEMAFIYGEGAEDGSAVKRLEKIKGIAAYDASGLAVPTKLIVTDYLLLADMQSNPMVLTGMLDNGLFTTGTDGKSVAKGKSEVPGAKTSGHYLKYSVRLLGDLKAALGPLPGQTLQITPVNAVLPKQQGESLKLRALYNGKPIAGVKVLTDFVNDAQAKPLFTDKDGIVTLKVRNQGLNVIFATHEVPATGNEDTDIVQHAATLSFVLPAAGE